VLVLEELELGGSVEEDVGGSVEEDELELVLALALEFELVVFEPPPDADE